VPLVQAVQARQRQKFAALAAPSGPFDGPWLGRSQIPNCHPQTGLPQSVRLVALRYWSCLAPAGLVAFGDSWTGSWWSLNEFAKELSKNRDRTVLAAFGEEALRCQFELAHRLLNQHASKVISKQKAI
jgi:hypothetical protein